MRTGSLLAFVLIGLSCFGNAQNAVKRTCRVIFPDRPGNAPKVAYIFDGKQNHLTELPTMNFSQVLALPSGEITILMSPEEITDIEKIPSGLPRMNIPETIRDFFILVTSDPANPAMPLKMNLVNTADDKLKSGETLWFNLTSHSIHAKLGEARLEVPPKNQVVSKNPVSESGYYRAEFAYQPDGAGELLRITEQHWWHDTKSKHLGLIIDSGGRLPRVFMFRDFRDPEADEAQGDAGEGP
jgi:hypothetical protein